MSDPIVWAWTALAVTGVVVQASLTWDAIRTLHGLLDAGVDEDGALATIAFGHVRSGFAYLLVHSAFLAIGLAVLVESANAGRIARWSFIGAAILLLAVGLADQRDRVNLRQRRR